MLFPIPRPLWQNAIWYFSFSVVSLNVWSALAIFQLGRYESKLGGPWDNFVAGFWLSLAISAAGAVGYLAALQAVGRWLAGSPPVWRVAVASLAALMFLALGGAGVVGEFARWLPLSGVGNLMLAFFLAGALVGSAAVFLLGFWARTREGT